MSGCNGAGVLLATGARVTLDACDVLECRGVGVLVLANCVLDATGGEVRGCAEGGVAVVGRAAASLARVVVSANGGASVSAKAHGRLVMKQCVIREACGMGVQLSDGAEGSISECKLLGCSKAALAAKAAGRLLISGVRVSA